MPLGSMPEGGPTLDPSTASSPAISICESCPGTAVFLESGNTDGWIASDLTVEITE